MAHPEEIAPAYVYLASDADSSYTVGETIAATGGYTGSAEDDAGPPATPSCESPGAQRGGRPRDPTEPPW